MNIKIKSRNVKPTAAQMETYKNNRFVVRESRVDLRFGKVAITSDADVDG